MKRFNRLFAAVVVILIAGIIGVNIFIRKQDDYRGRPYQVEIERVVRAIGQGQEPDMSAMSYVKAYSLCQSKEDMTATGAYDYCLREVEGDIYRIEYVNDDGSRDRMIVLVNAAMLVSGLCILIILLVIKYKIISPFHKLEDVPYQLSKGNLTIPLEENKYKLFGRFIWGTNMLREKIDERRREELEMHKEKKTVLLSLAHDIKTPLSVIKLNAQAIEKGLYNDEESRNNAARAIVGKVDEIGTYVSQIVSATKDDFLKLEVIDGELYLEELVSRIRVFYSDKLEQLKIPFTIKGYMNCLLKGDIDRLEEVLQNLIENAIKYGDGRFIDISFSREEDCQLITVSNSGNTLPTEEGLHVFDSFYRGSNVGSQEGSGLGLYICRKLMTQMKGDIFVHPEGDIFKVSIVTRLL